MGVIYPKLGKPKLDTDQREKWAKFHRFVLFYSQISSVWLKVQPFGAENETRALLKVDRARASKRDYFFVSVLSCHHLGVFDLTTADLSLSLSVCLGEESIDIGRELAPSTTLRRPIDRPLLAAVFSLFFFFKVVYGRNAIAKRQPNSTGRRRSHRISDARWDVVFFRSRLGGGLWTSHLLFRVSIFEKKIGSSFHLPSIADHSDVGGGWSVQEASRRRSMGPDDSTSGRGRGAGAVRAKLGQLPPAKKNDTKTKTKNRKDHVGSMRNLSRVVSSTSR